MGTPNGSLVEARLNPAVYVFILLALAVLGILFLLLLLVRHNANIRQTPEWIEAHKNDPTTRSQVKQIAEAAKLKTFEEKLLWIICRRFSLPNILITYKNLPLLDDYFKKEYEYIKTQERNEKVKLALFSLRFKLQKYKESVQGISSTKALSHGQEFIYSTGYDRWIFTLASIDMNGIGLFVPESFTTAASRDLLPKPLDKINLFFTVKDSLHYMINIRVIRYGTDKDGREIMYISHTNSLSPVQRRNAKRLATNTSCTFSAVEVSRDETGKVKLNRKESKYPGKIVDISSTGCRMKCNMPIKKGQLIYVDFCIDGKNSDSALGSIVNTNKSTDSDTYIIHIHFIDVKLTVRNRISAIVYGYETI